MKQLTLFLLFLSFNTFAQLSIPFRIDSLPTEGVLLDKNWKFKAGDSLEWAKVDFDETAWEIIDPTKDIMDLPQVRQAGMGYIRIHLWIDSSLVGKAIALQLWQTCASEIFLNGVLIHQLGIVSPNSSKEYMFLPNGQPYSIIFQKVGIQTLSIRYAFTQSNFLLKYKPTKYPFFQATLFHLDKTIANYARNKNNYALEGYFKMGLLFFLGLLHLFFYISYRQQIANLYISLYALSFTVSFYFDNIISLPVDGRLLFHYTNLNILLIVLSGAFSLLTIYSFLEIPKTRWFWLMLIFIILGYPFSLYSSDFAIFYSALIMSGILAFESIRVSLKAIDEKRYSVRYIIGGWVSYLLFMGLYYSIIFGILPMFQLAADLSVNLAIVSVPIFYSLMLAADYAKTTRSLAHKLKEVEILSVEKQQILSNQNETLEKQVTERTAELNQSITELKIVQTQLESKNRDLEIEGTLEKVRSKALAMQKSDEIMDVAVTWYNELQKLGFKSGLASIMILDSETGDMEIWNAGFNYGKYPESYQIGYFDAPYQKAILSAWRNGVKFLVYKFTDEEKRLHDEYLFTKTPYKNIPAKIQKQMIETVNLTYSLAFTKHGTIVWAPTPLSEEKAAILQRFANVFEQAYTRFLDLQKTEIQAEKAKLDLIQIQTEKKRAEDAIRILKATQTQLIEKEKMASLGALRLQELDAVKTRLYTNITHEFRTPLTVILGMAHQIMSKPKEYLADGLKMIVRNGQNLLHLVNQMLDLSKLEGAKLTLHYQQGDIVNFLRYITESFHSLGEKKDVRILFLTDLEYLIMDYEEMRLQQIVSNLLSNAVKFTPKGGFINVSLGTKNNALVVKIKDTGIGISETDLPFIFDRFYRVDEAHTHEGTGIGLALTYELVKLLKGTISVKSALGKGTEFEVVLPIRHESEIKSIQESNVLTVQKNEEYLVSLDETVSSIKKPNQVSEIPIVLIADDNMDVRAYIASCFTTDYQLAIAKDGQECEDMAFDTTPDLIILDVMMPFKNGFDVCKTLKTDVRTSHIPIIMLTAKADIDSKLNGLERGADAYMMKPFNKEELLLRIKKLLELRRKLQQYYLSTIASVEFLKSTEGVNNGTKMVPSERDNPFINSLDNAFVLKVKTTVEYHLADYDLDVEKLGRILALSPSQVNRKLSALTGLTTNSFIRSVRLIKSKAMLQNSGYSIAAISYDSGFNDPAYFSRVFKQAFGVTPQVWREANPVE